MSKTRYIQKWLDARPSNVATTDGQRAHGEGEGEGEGEQGFAAGLYYLCQSVMGVLCSQEQDSPSRRLQSLLLREELAKLYLWGQSFGPGELDTALDYSDDARYLVLDALGKVGRSLLLGKILETQESYLVDLHLVASTDTSSTNKALAEISRLSDLELKPVPAQQSQELLYFVEQTKNITSNRAERDEETSSDDSYETEEDSTSDSEKTTEIVQDVNFHINCLVQLGPTLQQNLLYARKARIESSYPPVVPFRLSNPAKIYVSLIRDKYRNAEDQLVDRLGESNWQRHKMVREQLRRHSQEKDIFVEEDVKNQDGPCSLFRPYSTFHDSGIGTSVPAHTEYARSHASFQSSNVEGEQGSLRVPPTPEEVSAGKPFQCPYCGQTLLNIKNRVDWKSVSKKPFVWNID